MLMMYERYSIRVSREVHPNDDDMEFTFADCSELFGMSFIKS